MKEYNHLAGYKRRSRERRDAFKIIKCGESTSKLRYDINQGWYVKGDIDERGRLRAHKNIRIKMQFRAYELVYGKKY
jgi:hypothetical protein